MHQSAKFTMKMLWIWRENVSNPVLAHFKTIREVLKKAAENIMNLAPKEGRCLRMMKVVIMLDSERLRGFGD